MSACDCCGQPPCPSPSLSCESFSASGSIQYPSCTYFSDGKYYTTRTTTHSGGYSASVPTCGFMGLGTGTESGTYTSTETSVKEIVGGSCQTTHTYSGSSTYIFDCPSYNNTTCTTTQASDGTWSGTFSYQNFGNPSEDYSVPYNVPCHATVHSTITNYSGEIAVETPAELIARVEGLIPSTPNGSSCSALRNLSPDETSYSICRVKWCIQHPPTGTCYLKVWLQKTFRPEDGGSPTITPITPYEWTGTGNPCLTDPTLPPTHPDNLILGPQTTENEPATDGATTIQIVKWSCVPDYEPAEGEPNGFPPLPEPE